MHGRVFAHETLTEAIIVLQKEVAVAVVVEHALSQVQQGPQLAKGVAVRLHFPGVVREAKKDAAAVGGDVASFLDNVEKAAAHHLQTGRCGETLFQCLTSAVLRRCTHVQNVSLLRDTKHNAGIVTDD